MSGVPGVNLSVLRQAVADGRIEWRKHVLQRLAERKLRQSAVLDVLQVGDVIEDYPDDKPFPSGLFFGYVGGRPLHVVAALDEVAAQAYIITAYEPSAEIFEADYRTRRKRSST